LFTFSALPLGSRGRTGLLLDGSGGTGRGRPSDVAVLLGLLVAAALISDRLLVVHGRSRGWGAKVHVV